VNIQGDARPEIVVSLNDGYMYAFSADSQRLWRYDYTNGKAIMFASEVAVADLNQDGSPEIIFTTYGAPDVLDSGHLVILASNGALLYDVPLPNPGQDGNGNGAPAAPTVADLDGDGQLEILVQTFDHGLDIFTVPGSASNCLLWTTARGGPLRMGAANGN
ncbi:MAG TPA: VCBS repeat-containing protein, partial [Anaeromyxobacteraceae bacterium]|nr:VCBS repeat-containing protein [Anaeromyxobacteraceae bacterium]